MARAPLNFRISQDGLDRLDALQAQYHVTRTQVLKACLAVAFAHIGEVQRILGNVEKIN